jgi:hypothetical protein
MVSGMSKTTKRSSDASQRRSPTSVAYDFYAGAGNCCHFEHNYGHGYQHLSVVFAVLMMLAFSVDQVQQLCCPLFQAVWAQLRSKRRLWEKMRALFYTYALESMRHLFEALLYSWKKTAPILALDSS